MIRFSVGDEDSYDREKMDWVRNTFPKSAYRLVDTGWHRAEYYVEFPDSKDALLYKLRWA